MDEHADQRSAKNAREHNYVDGDVTHARRLRPYFTLMFTMFLSNASVIARRTPALSLNSMIANRRDCTGSDQISVIVLSEPAQPLFAYAQTFDAIFAQE